MATELFRMNEYGDTWQEPELFDQMPGRCPFFDGPDDPMMVGIDERGEWVACEHPERPADRKMNAFPFACGACEIATTAAIRHEHGSLL